MKTIEISLERDKDGWLHGYVIERTQDAQGDETVQKGTDLLKHGSFARMDSARNECEARIKAMFESLPKPKIVYTYPAL